MRSDQGSDARGHGTNPELQRRADQEALVLCRGCVRAFLPQLHRRIQKQSKFIGAVGSLFVKVATLMELPRLRVEASQQSQVLTFYSTELDLFMQAVLRVRSRQASPHPVVHIVSCGRDTVLSGRSPHVQIGICTLRAVHSPAARMGVAQPDMHV